MKRRVCFTFGVLFAGMLVSCATPTSVPPTATPTSIPPTATPTPIPSTATPTSVPTSAVSMLKPGDKIGDMVLTTEEGGSTGIWDYCDPYITESDPATITRGCEVPDVSSLFIGTGISAGTTEELDSSWQTMIWELTLDDYPVDLSAFGTIDVDAQDRKLRLWSVVVEKVTPGKHALRYFIRDTQGRGDPLDVTWNFTVASPVSTVTGATPLPVQPTPTPLPEPRQPVARGAGDLPWWNDRVFYEVFVRSFMDSDGDGIGDLQGLIAKLDYLNDGNPMTETDLGVTGLWLMPVAESPSYHGYDVVDYTKIEQDYGTNEDFKQLLAEAHKRDVVVIVDLVMNHTSSQHPWFLDAQTPGSEHEAWYIWRSDSPGYVSPWGSQVWHPLGGRYYYGLFWEGMPDLNYENGAVTLAMRDIIRFWLQDMQVDGFRLDAVRHLIEDGPVQENTPATHAWLQDFYRYVHSLAPDALTVGEIWDESLEVSKYVGNQVDVAFEFDLAGAILDALRDNDNQALVQAQETALKVYPQGQYAAFLTNHDQNRVMNRLQDDVPAAKAAATLLLTNPGVPFIYYGEEIGMQGAKPDERIRTPMQWDGTATAGFTSGIPWEDLNAEAQRVNVAAEATDPDSLLNHYRTLIHLRQAHPALRVGHTWLVNTGSRQVYSFLRHGAGETALIVVNLSTEPVSDYRLTLAEGPLTGTPRALLLLGEGQPVAPTLNASGGFDAYAPLPALAPYGSLVVLLSESGS